MATIGVRTDLYDAVIDITGVDRETVKRTLLALGYAPADLVARMTGIAPELVQRIELTYEAVSKKDLASGSRPPPIHPGSEGAISGKQSPVVKPAAAFNILSQPAKKPDASPTPEAELVPAGRKAKTSQETVTHQASIRTGTGASPAGGATPDPGDGSSPAGPNPGEGSGAFIRRLLLANQYSPDEIVALVLANFEGRKTTVKDVRWNYDKLRTDGVAVPEWRGPAPKGGYPKQGPQHPAKGITTERLLGRSSQKQKLLLTGATAMQVGSEKTQLKIITAQASWKAALTELGFEVDWRPVVPGEDLSGYSKVVVAMNKGTVRTATHFYGTLWATAQRPDAVMAFDDWQTKDVLSSLESFARVRERAFRLTRANQGAVDVNAAVLYGEVLKLSRGSWHNTCVVPAFRDGNVDLLGIPSKRVVAIDPTAHAKRYPPVDVDVRRSQWVLASLLDKKHPKTRWPLICYGNPDKKAGQGAAGPNAQPRLEEPELMKVYCTSRGVISPAHDHAGSGWWRVRYLMAADAGCVLSADPREAVVLGQPYMDASKTADVESLSDRSCDELAQAQAARLKKVSMSKEEVLATWREVLAW